MPKPPKLPARPRAPGASIRSAHDTSSTVRTTIGATTRNVSPTSPTRATRAEDDEIPEVDPALLGRKYDHLPITWGQIRIAVFVVSLAIAVLGTVATGTWYASQLYNKVDNLQDSYRETGQKVERLSTDLTRVVTKVEGIETRLQRQEQRGDRAPPAR